MYQRLLIKKTIKPVVSVLAVIMAITLAAAGMDIKTHAAVHHTSRYDTKSHSCRETKQYVIAQDGTGDFATIQEGVDSASDGDTLLIYPGIYTEEVQVMNKEINIVGVSRELCVLQYDTAFYRKVPLTIAAGTVSNLTIYGMNSGVEQEGPTEEEIALINSELVGDNWDRQKNYKGYAVHVDQNFLYGRSICFENCRIISENSHCVGMGTRGGCIISFDNCELVSAGDGSCIYMHDPTNAEVSGEASLIMKNCRMTSYLSPYVMTFQSLLPEYNTMYLTFQNTDVSAVAYAESESYVPINVNTGFDVETLSELEKAGALHVTDGYGALKTLVHEFDSEDTKAYMDKIEEARNTGDYTQVMVVNLAEGITYIGKEQSETTKEKECGQKNAKHQVIAIYNIDNQPGNGWCGLDNAYLTEDSSGNTLLEMNAY